MNKRYEERLNNILQFKEMTIDEKLELAFEEQARNESLLLMDNGANPQVILNEAKKLGGWNMSILQDDLVREAIKRL